MPSKDSNALVEAGAIDYFSEGVKREYRLHQFENYVLRTYEVFQRFWKLTDKRRDPDIGLFDVVNCLFHAAVLRIPSFHQLEKHLNRRMFQNLLGRRSRRPLKLYSAEVLANVSDKLVLQELEETLTSIIKKAERNKAFRDDTYGTFRCVALDGWEPFCGYERHCELCLTRQVKHTEVDEAGNKTITRVTQYYHRFVVAMLIAPHLDLVMAIEPVRSEHFREDDETGHEGELTAAYRLLDRLHSTYGRFIDAFALDALYANGPMMTKLHKYRYGAFITTKDKTKDPLRFANEVWDLREGPNAVEEDEKQKREYWELKDVDALKTFAGSVDMLKIVLTTKAREPKKPKVPRKRPYINVNVQKVRPEKKQTWVMAKVGKAKKANHQVAEKIIRSRWHIENTAFHQFVTKWNLGHCFRHTANAICAILLIWMIAFNLMQLFWFRRLRMKRSGAPGTSEQPTMTFVVTEMFLDMAGLNDPVPWHILATTPRTPGIDDSS